ncbi:MAG: hypothetical protein KDC03_22605 [Flavobacteriales bacterium]|nr:hypothetical protein [Flavobacteriales bacterium]
MLALVVWTVFSCSSPDSRSKKERVGAEEAVSKEQQQQREDEQRLQRIAAEQGVVLMLDTFQYQYSLDIDPFIGKKVLLKDYVVHDVISDSLGGRLIVHIGSGLFFFEGAPPTRLELQCGQEDLSRLLEVLRKQTLDSPELVELFRQLGESLDNLPPLICSLDAFRRFDGPLKPRGGHGEATEEELDVDLESRKSFVATGTVQAVVEL